MAKKAATVVIVGGGVAGLVAVKSCIDYGLEPVCFEATSNIGGLWCYEDSLQLKASLMSNLTTNTSKEMMCFSDFSFPNQLPAILHHSQVFSYLKLYCEKFDLLKYIKFRHRVLKVQKASDYENTGEWDVTVQQEGDSTFCATYQAVFLCDGMYNKPSIPLVENMELFKGKVIHSTDFRIPDVFRNQRVLVIGSSNSGSDCAVELANTASQTYLSSRSGFFILPKYNSTGLPPDYRFTSRFGSFIRGLLPRPLLTKFFGKKLNEQVGHDVLGCAPAVPNPFSGTVVNDHLAPQLLAGRVLLQPGVRRCVGSDTFEMTDGTVLSSLDAVIFATGYTQVDLDVLEDGIIETDDNKLPLYLRMFPVPKESEFKRPGPTRHSLAILGRLRVGGAVPPLLEMQARLAAAVIAGTVTLPSRTLMLADIERRDKQVQEIFRGAHPHYLFVDTIEYRDELAALIGCAPNLMHLFFTDLRLWRAVVFGPSTPYQWRLTGPHMWPGARDAIFSQEDKMRAAYKNISQRLKSM